MKKLLLIALAFVTLSATAGNMTTKLVVNNPICYGTSDGSIELYVFGGTPPFTYTWDNGLPPVATHTGLAAGSYSFTVSDNIGDVVNGTVVVAQPDEILATPTILDVTTQGGNDGAIGLYVTGGTPAFAFNWSNNVQDRNISRLTAGTYSVEITDAAGCMKTFSFVVNEPNGFIAQKPEEKYLVSKGSFHGSNNTGKGAEHTGIEEEKQVVTNVYPNPANNFFNITLQQGAENQIALINPNGQIVAQQQASSGETQLNVSDVPNGNYILSIRNENGITNKMVSVLK